MRRALLSLGVGLGIVFGSVSTAQAQYRRGGNGGGFGGGMMRPQPFRPAPYHPNMRRGFYPQPKPVAQPNYRRAQPVASPGGFVRPRPAPVSAGKRPIVTSSGLRNATASTRGSGTSSSISTRAYKTSNALALTAGAKPSTRAGIGGKGALALTGSSKGSALLGSNRKATTKLLGGGGKPGVKGGVLSASNQAKVQKALNRLRNRIKNALLLAAMANMACGQPLTGAQCSCLGQYINSPDCGLTPDEQVCVQQGLGGGDPGETGDTGEGGDNGSGDNGDANGGDNGGEDAAGDANANGSDGQDDGGVFIRAVDKQAAAAQAGLRAGDTILSFGDVRTHTFDDLQNAVRQAGGRVKVVFRNGETNAVEYLMVEPQDGRIGVTCE